MNRLQSAGLKRERCGACKKTLPTVESTVRHDGAGRDHGPWTPGRERRQDRPSGNPVEPRFAATPPSRLAVWWVDRSPGFRAALGVAALTLTVSIGSAAYNSQSGSVALGAPPTPAAQAAVSAPNPPEAAPDASPDLVLLCGSPALTPFVPGVPTTILMRYEASQPFPVHVDFGDGTSAANVSRLFIHDYALPGDYSVTATQLGVEGSVNVASCTASWRPLPVRFVAPALPADQLPPGNGYTVTCADGTTSSSGGLQGACSYHGGIG
jgi:hypothetical protein